MAVSNANRRAVNCYASSPKITEFACPGSGMHAYFILHQSSVNATQAILNCFHFTSSYAYILPMFCHLWLAGIRMV